ncbi:helicase-related protein [Acidocella aquatica]|nr:helicase-related protein [Acidocella aquatica]
MPPKDNFDLFANDLFGSTMLSSDAMIPIGLIRIPMKEDPNEPDENAHLYDDPATRAASSPVAENEQKFDARNFRLSGTRNLSAGWKHRAQDNLAAIRLMQQIEEEGRGAMPEEQAQLVKFCAFSSTDLAQNVFRRGAEELKSGWAEIALELEALVSAEERAGLMRATQYAHFTPEYIVRAMWAAVLWLGFAGGSVLEPGCGTGLFIAGSPEHIAQASHFTGIEADPITAKIAAQLYPESDIRFEDFTRAKLSGDYDLTIGNPPFSDRSQRFAEVKPAVALSLHDYFIAKSVRALRPGGIAAFVVSRWTMDKTDSTARRLIAEMADLLGAVRLPERAMRQDAGTDVVVDVLFFQRRGEGQPGNAMAWLDTSEAVAPLEDSPGFDVNTFFLDHPEMVLGLHSRTSSPYGLVYTCKGQATGGDLEAALNTALQALPRGIHQPRTETLRKPGEAARKIYAGGVADGATVREGSYLVIANRLHQVIDGIATEIPVKRGKGEGIPVKSAHIIDAMIPIRDAVRAILRAQESNRPWTEYQRALRRAHTKFVRNHGPINKTEITTITDEDTGQTREMVRRPNIAPFADDPDVWLVASIEDYDQETGKARHGAIFTQRVIHPPKAPVIVTAADALSVCLHDTGRVDIEYIAESLCISRQEAEAALGRAVFLNPENRAWETADAYLSGPVRTKLAVAQAVAVLEPRFAANVEALQAAQPVDLKPSEITARLGAPWIPPKVIALFCKEILGVETAVRHIAGLGSWMVDRKAFEQEASSATEWGTARRHAGHLVDDALNASIPQIWDVWYEDGQERRKLNPEETEAAKEKLFKIKTAFQNWVWTEAERAEELSNIYNATMNNMVPRHFDGSHLTLPGASTVINFYPHQKRVIWRIITAGGTYMAHAVGSGKTFSMAAAVMEQKRLGLVNKTMMVVPGHCLAQASREFLLLYPTARILVADDVNFAKAKRKRFLARAAMGDWDCIIITHAAFRFIPIPAAFERTMIQEQLDAFEAMLDDVDSDDRISRKRIERMKEGFEAKLENLGEGTDDFLTISEIGVDQIIVDEAQEFRKLAFPTNQTTLKGVDPNGSQRAWDLFVKTRFIETINAGRPLVMASGTPITNTMGELFTLQRFFAQEILERMGLQHFDGWASNFGDARTELELQPSGTYKPVTRFSEFVNVPELIDIFRSFADVVLPADLRQYVKLPNVATGTRQVITAQPTKMFKSYQKHLAARIKAIQERKGKPEKGDDILLSVIGDGRHAAIDLRFVAPSLPNDPESKLNLLIENAFRIYEENKDNLYEIAPGVPYETAGAGQMIFSDLGTLAVEARRGFSAYRWIREQLIAKGVRASEIAFMQDFKKPSEKQRLFNAFNAGQVRFLIGSSQTMGTGVNAQKRLKALHHLDVPWLPSDIEQREGRIIRQGNQNEEVEVYCYATLTSMDAPMWGQNQRKQRFIEAALSGDRSIRRLEDAGSQANQFAMAKAIASGDQRLMQKAGLEAEIARLVRLQDAHIDNQMAVRRTIQGAKASIEHNQQRIVDITADIAQRVETRGDHFALALSDRRFTERKAAGAAILTAIMEAGWDDTSKIAGAFAGFKFGIKLHRDRKLLIEGSEFVIQRRNKRDVLEIPENPTPLGIIARLEAYFGRIDAELEEAELRVAEGTRRVADYEPRLGAPFDLQGELDAKMAELRDIDIALAETKEEQTAEEDEFADIFGPIGRAGDCDELDDTSSENAEGASPE